jgi:hypothetical protein
MQDYNYQSRPSGRAYIDTHSIMMTAFGWMFAGLLVSAATSFLLYSTGFFLRLLYSVPMLSLILAIAQIALVIGFSASAKKATATGMKVLFMAYAVTLGISLTSLAYVYGFGTISVAFLVSAVYFGCLAIIGLTTKRDLTKMGTIMIAGLFAMIITQLVMMLFGVSMDTRLISIIGLLIFTGLTAWDMQKLGQISRFSMDDATSEKIGVYFALELYLDFINIFLYILRLLGNNRRN